LWWANFWILGAAFLFTMVILALALARSRRGRYLTDRQSEWLVIAGGVAVPLAVLLGLLVYSVLVSRAFSTEPYEQATRIEVEGRQWWWNVRYLDAHRQVIARTANEIHVPVGRPVLFELKSSDVIHSFWVPNLNGKMDLIPGRTNKLWLQADRPGVYRGQCAEYCGFQHAHMALELVANARFEEWLEHQKHGAPEPAGDSTLRGRQIFLAGPCVMCHSVSGTPAMATFGPDLTHVASRRKLAAGTLPNTRGSLGGWIVNAQGVKPGNHMPRINLSSENLEDLLSYLETLK
jgi:cytochrome c oxidase subunit 2